MDTVRADFDRLAEFDSKGWNHNTHYHDFLLRQMPAHVESALDIGCGTGCFARLLASRADHVVGIDLSPNMIRLAQERSTQFPNIRYDVADVLATDLPPEAFDCIASIATLHHVPLETALLKAKDALKPGGVLLVLDLFQDEGIGDLMNSVLAVPVNCLLTRIKCGRQKTSPQAQAAWDQHGEHDTYLTLREVRRIARPLLPGAIVRRHLLWRYSLVWQKPG